MSKLCRDVRTLLSLYAEGELSEADARDVALHVRDCRPCAHVVARYDAVTHALLGGEQDDSGSEVDHWIAAADSTRRVEETMEQILYGPPPDWLAGDRPRPSRVAAPDAGTAYATQPCSGSALPPPRRVRRGLAHMAMAAGWLLGTFALYLALRPDPVPVGTSEGLPPGALTFASRAEPVSRDPGGWSYAGGTRGLGRVNPYWGTRAVAPFAVNPAPRHRDVQMELVALPVDSLRQVAGPSEDGETASGSPSRQRLDRIAPVVRVLARPAETVLSGERIYLVPQTSDPRRRLLQVRRVDRRPAGVSIPWRVSSGDRPQAVGARASEWVVYRAIAPVRALELPCEPFRGGRAFSGHRLGGGRVEPPDRVPAFSDSSFRLPRLDSSPRLPASWAAFEREL